MPDITISLSGAAATRLQDTMTESLDLRDEDGLQRAATMADAKAYIVQNLKQLIKTSENRVAIAAIATSADPTIT